MTLSEFALARVLRKRLNGGDWTGAAIFQRLQTNYNRCENLVRMFYLFMVFKSYQLTAQTHALASSDAAFDLLWPIAWARDLDMVIVANTLGMLCLGSALLAVLAPAKPVFRIAFAICLLPLLAIPMSLGSINHGNHALFWVTVVFALLPVAKDRASRLAYCLTFAGAQGLLMTFYTLAGFHKIRGGVESLLLGIEGSFSPRGLAHTLAARVVETGTEPVLARFVIENYWLAWPGFLAIIYIQFTALIVAFRPSLHSVAGLALMSFHIGTFLLMEIPFPNHIFLLMLLMVVSPFAHHHVPEFAAARYLPGVEWLLLRQSSHRQATNRTAPA